MALKPKRLRYTDETPPVDLWRQFPIWEYCLDEEGDSGQHEGTIRPSNADNWGYAFDVRAPYDLALVFGEAITADGRTLPAKILLHGLIRSSDVGVVEIYFASPRVRDVDCWTFIFSDKNGVWKVQNKPYNREAPFTDTEEFAVQHPGVLPLTVRTFAPRVVGIEYSRRISPNEPTAGRPAG